MAIKAAIIHPQAQVMDLDGHWSNHISVVSNSREFSVELNKRLRAFYEAQGTEYKAVSRAVRPDLHVIEFDNDTLAADVRLYLQLSGHVPTIQLPENYRDTLEQSTGRRIDDVAVTDNVKALLEEEVPLANRRIFLQNITKEAKAVAPRSAA